jgi:hypothetical protein
MSRLPFLIVLVLVLVLAVLAPSSERLVALVAGGQSPPEVLLGAHYYPWYRAPRRDGPPDEPPPRGWMSEALRGRLVPRQMPALGVYDSRDPEVIAGHIRQSLRAGIDFWSVSWWGPGRRDDETFREHLLKHPDHAQLRYAVLYESTGRLGSFDRPDYTNWVPDFQYLRERYFGHPRYLRIEGRPVVFVYLPATRTLPVARSSGASAAPSSGLPHPTILSSQEPAMSEVMIASMTRIT